MSLYNEVYNDTLSTAHTQYKKLHNLYLLKTLRQKLDCYKTNPQNADSYYNCFFEIEGALMRQSQDFVNSCDQIDDQYKICLADCKENYRVDEKKKGQCFTDCGSKFRNSIAFLYENFYKTNVGKEGEYKNARNFKKE